MGWDEAFEVWWELLNFSFFKMCIAPVSVRLGVFLFFFFNLTTNFTDLLEAWDLAGA